MSGRIAGRMGEHHGSSRNSMVGVEVGSQTTPARDAMIRMLEHTAEAGFELEAPTLEVLFEEARRALLTTLFERG